MSTPADGNTRLMGRQNLSVPHTLLRRAYPNVGNAELASPAREAANQFARECMLAQPLPAAHVASVCRAIPE